MAEPSIQESLYPTLTCFGCGHANPDGFHLRSYRRGDRSLNLPVHLRSCLPDPVPVKLRAFLQVLPA